MSSSTNAPPTGEKKHHITPNMPPAGSSAGFVDKIDPFKRASVKRTKKKLQGSSRYRNEADNELTQLPLLKGDEKFHRKVSLEHCSLFRIKKCFKLSKSL